MEEQGLPERMFETGYEPRGRKRINSYFNLRWLESIKTALDKDQLQMLANTQFSHVMQMGSHTFAVMFVHYLLSRQLVTEKEYEFWWVFAGKPIRYAMSDFALITGLNCEKPQKKKIVRLQAKGARKAKEVKEDGKVWKELFRKGDKPTTSYILDRDLLGKKYKDSLTRFRLALLLLVEGVLCPTCGSTNIRPEVVEMLDDIEAFMQYTWERESFLWTVRSTKTRTPSHFVQESTAIQGFTHAMVLR